MTRTELLYKIKGKRIDGFIETPGSTEEDVRIIGLTTEDGYEFLFKATAGSESYEATLSHPAYDVEKTRFMEKLAEAKPDRLLFFRAKELNLEEIRTMVKAHAAEIKAGGYGANIHHDGSIRIRFDEEDKRRI